MFTYTSTFFSREYLCLQPPVTSNCNKKSCVNPSRNTRQGNRFLGMWHNKYGENVEYLCIICYEQRVWMFTRKEHVVPMCISHVASCRKHVVANFDIPFCKSRNISCIASAAKMLLLVFQNFQNNFWFALLPECLFLSKFFISCTYIQKVGQWGPIVLSLFSEIQYLFPFIR